MCCRFQGQCRYCKMVAVTNHFWIIGGILIIAAINLNRFCRQLCKDETKKCCSGRGILAFAMCKIYATGQNENQYSVKSND